MKSDNKKTKSPFPLRLLDDIEEFVKQGSKTNQRSKNAEINFQLMKAYELKSTHEVEVNEKASTAATVEAHESTLNTQSKGDCNGNYSK